MIKISKQWLNDWLERKDIPTDQLVEQLNMSGFEVDSVESVAFPFSKVVVAEILDIIPHPQADKLKLCTVNCGNAESLRIVCGAPNVYPGMKAPLALVGAKLGGVTIKEATLRGELSQGMLCSAKELGLSDSSEGLLDLPAQAPVGKDFREYFQLDDVVLNIELTANRGDCASIKGISREVAAITRCQWEPLPLVHIEPRHSKVFPVILREPEACPRYVGRIIKKVNPHAKTPIWMQERLRRGGMKVIHPIVDVTNYVLLELGQPLHAFDLSQLQESIEVRFAHSQETLELLDGTKLVLNPDTLVIADQKKVLALAGIKGGVSSGITESTTDILLESAYFASRLIIGKAKTYGMQTEASYRFEHGVDFTLQADALERATQLLLEIVGGEPGPLFESKSEAYLPVLRTIELPIDKIEKLLGVMIPLERAQDILVRLGMTVEHHTAKTWRVSIPPHRFDLLIAEDLIGEIARIYGYNTLPMAPATGELPAVSRQLRYEYLRQARQLLKDRDYHEIITYSFIDPQEQQLFDPHREAIPLLNAMSKDMSVMRTSLWPSLVATLIYNLNHQVDRIRIFENGLRYEMQDKENKKIIQEEVISGLHYGSLYAEQWGSSPQLIDFFDLKSDVLALLNLTEKNPWVEFKFEGIPPSLHPGKSAAIYLHGQCVGYLGMLHPRITQIKNLKHPVYVFEILANIFDQETKPIYSPVSKYPSIRRDLAFILDRSVSAEAIEQLVRKTVGSLLVDFILFDLYQEASLGQDKKSLAFRIVLQHSDKTLQDDEVNEMINRIIDVLKQTFNAKLRES